MKRFSLLLAAAAMLVPASGKADLRQREINPHSHASQWNQIVGSHRASTPSISSDTRASEEDSQSLIWGWCEEPDSAGPFPEGWYCTSVIGFPSSLTEKFKNCYVTSILVCKGQFVDDPVIDLFMSYGQEVPDEWGGTTLDLEEPFLSMKDVAFPGEAWEWVEFELPESYLIEGGKAFYVGWGYLNTNENNVPLVSDGVCTDNLDSSWMDGYDPADPTSDYGYWNNCSSAGANCIRLRISGDNLPSDDIVISSISAPRAVVPGQTFEVTLNVSNAATSDINEIDVKYTIAGGEEKSLTLSGLSIAAGGKDTIKIDGIESESVGNIVLDIEITSVNGKNDADYTNNMISAYILSLPDGVGFERNIVVEEGTGTWCGNCPRGIVGMREMAEKYQDRFIGIAAHSSDEMAIEAYQPFLNKYIDVVGYPWSVVDRAIAGDPNFEELEENFLREAEVPAIAEVSITDMELMGDMLYVNPSVKFVVSEENTDYGWAYVVTEDNVGPYFQTSYYTDGSLPGWDETKSAVLMTFDEVAMAANKILGVSSIPSTTEAGTAYSLPMTFDASRVQNWDNAHVIVMLINMKTGYIENAVRESFKTTGVSCTGSDASIRIVATEGMITLMSGEKADIYTLAGHHLVTLSAGESMEADNGIYIARVNGRIYKLMVK